MRHAAERMQPHVAWTPNTCKLNDHISDVSSVCLVSNTNTPVLMISYEMDVSTRSTQDFRVQLSFLYVIYNMYL